MKLYDYLHYYIGAKASTNISASFMQNYGTVNVGTFGLFGREDYITVYDVLKNKEINGKNSYSDYNHLFFDLYLYHFNDVKHYTAVRALLSKKEIVKAYLIGINNIPLSADKLHTLIKCDIDVFGLIENKLVKRYENKTRKNSI